MTTTTMLDAGARLLKTTDGARAGFGQAVRARRSEAVLSDLTSELSTAVGDAYWSFMLYGELEDAFDAAFLRAALAETPTLSGSQMVWAF
jgi:hypothetical protein